VCQVVWVQRTRYPFKTKVKTQRFRRRLVCFWDEARGMLFHLFFVLKVLIFRSHPCSRRRTLINDDVYATLPHGEPWHPDVWQRAVMQQRNDAVIISALSCCKIASTHVLRELINSHVARLHQQCRRKRKEWSYPGIGSGESVLRPRGLSSAWRN
jgi:hypothetical protein